MTVVRDANHKPQGEDSPSHNRDSKLDLTEWPPIYVSSTHFETGDLHELEEQLVESGASLTYDVSESKIVLSKVTKKLRIQFDLKAKGLWTKEYDASHDSSSDGAGASCHPPAKRIKREVSSGRDQSDAIKVEDSSTASEADDDDSGANANSENVCKSVKSESASHPNAYEAPPQQSSSVVPPADNLVRVVRVEWFAETYASGKPLPLDDYLSYCGKVMPRPASGTTGKVVVAHPSSASTKSATVDPSTSIIERAKEDAPSVTVHVDKFGKRKFGQTAMASSGASWEAGNSSKAQYAHLLHMTTSENDSGASSDLPDMPEWVKQGVKYACQRLTPKDNPNEPFLALLKKIKLARLLTNDEIGVRAYSTSIAAIAAYPHKVSNPREIMLLPGCDAKIANLYVEYANSGSIKAVDDIEADEDLKILRLFYEIWGVGAITAREFYYEQGWRDLDDIVEFGWSTLSRVQQIGVKFYEEFLDPIPRAEVEQIGQKIHEHACRVRDDRVQSLIVGGYRRGKEACGDVDIIVSHPEEEKTLHIVNDIVSSLEDEGWITHTLLLSLNSTNRDQQTLPFRAGGGGHGFDTLDKALVVWQDPDWPTKDAELAANPKAKNPNIHRRVDIIIAPWRTVGCAVLGWSGGTTFQRDLRRYAKNEKAWKFDSSGLRDRQNGEVLDLEGYYDYTGAIGSGRSESMEQAEKRVLEGMGLVYREPWERCTG